MIYSMDMINLCVIMRGLIYPLLTIILFFPSKIKIHSTRIHEKILLRKKKMNENKGPRLGSKMTKWRTKHVPHY